MKVLVTGTRGQLVSTILACANDGDGLEFVAVGRSELDLEVPGSAAAAIRSARPDVVINAAAWTNVEGAEDEPHRAMRVNGEAAGEVAGASREIGAPVIQISTDYVFDGRAGSYKEDDPTNPLNVYGHSKLASEEAVRSANPRHLILRTAWVYGPFGNNFVAATVRRAANGEPIRVVDGELGSPTSALDLVAGIRMILNRWRQGDQAGFGETYHLAGAGSASWFDFAQAIVAECRTLGRPTAEPQRVASRDGPAKAERPANSTLDCRKFGDDFGYSAPEWRSSLRALFRGPHTPCAP